MVRRPRKITSEHLSKNYALILSSHHMLTYAGAFSEERKFEIIGHLQPDGT